MDEEGRGNNTMQEADVIIDLDVHTPVAALSLSLFTLRVFIN